MVRLRIGRSILSDTLFNIRDVLGTGYTCVCRGFDKRKNNRKKKNGENEAINKLCLVEDVPVFKIYSI
jgi:hypothetical protein